MVPMPSDPSNTPGRPAQDPAGNRPGDRPGGPPGPPPHQAELALTTLTADAFDAFHRAADRGFQEETPAEMVELDRAVVAPGRFYGFTVGERWVSTFGSFARRLTVPGGATIPVSAVTAVTVHSAYRRRGLLRRAMLHEFDLAAARGEIAAALYASESGIYGRFGYGMAQHGASLAGPTSGLALLPEAAAMLEGAGGSVDEVDRARYLALAAPLHERLRERRPGSLDRGEAWWNIRLADPAAWRDGATELRYVISYDAGGAIDGHATYRVKSDFEGGNPNGQALVGEVEAIGPAGYARLWRYLANLDLVRRFEARRTPTDDALQHLVADPRAITTRLTDGLYVRLLDVAAALAARRYAAPIDVAIEVRDDVLPTGGTYRLRTEMSAAPGGHEGAAGFAAHCRRVDEPPDMTLSVRELGAIYLGGTSLGALWAAGLVTEYRAGAVVRASAGFGWPVAPFCADMF